MGLLLVSVAGCMMGNFVLPLKSVRSWKWENTWVVFSLVSLFILPWALALGTVPGLFSVYGGVSLMTLSRPLLFGMLWGVAQVLFGICAVRIGMSLTYAIVIGLGGVTGSLVPLLVLQPEAMLSRRGLVLLTSLVMMLVGVAICARAGQIRDQLQQGGTKASGLHYARSLVLAVVAGVLSSALNLALAFGGDIVDAAVRSGARLTNAPYAVWAVTLVGGLIVNLGYAFRLLSVHRTWSNFVPVREAAHSILMGVLWMGAIAIYGTGVALLGRTGTSFGWALFQIVMVLAANVSGFITGEWKAVSRSTVGRLALGLGILFVATVVLASEVS